MKNMNKTGGRDPLDIARDYHQRGWCVTPVRPGGKSPLLNDWPNRRLTEVDLPAHFAPGTNVGVVLGEPSGHLVDIDLDCETARQLAPHLLPETATFGRASSPRSHWLYRVTESVETKKYQFGQIGTIVELRSTGGQTVFPGSTHPSGEKIEWADPQEPRTIPANELLNCVQEIAVATLLISHWPAKGCRHEASLAFGGGCARSRIELERSKRIMRAVAEATGAGDLQTKLKNIENSYQNVADSAQTTGWPRLAELLGDDVVAKIRKWLDADSFDVVCARNDDEGAGLQDIAVLCTDVGNAARFALRHGDRFRWCGAHGRWYVWSATHWSVDEREEVIKAAKEAALSILDEAKSAMAEERRSELIKHAARSQGKERLKAMVDLARPELAVVPEDFDQDPWLLNCENGTIDLRTGRLLGHDHKNLITKVSSVAYSTKSDAPTWLRFLARIFDGNSDLIGYVQRLLGYMLTGDVSEQILPVFWGQGANGKSTLLDAISFVLGDYADSAAPDLLMQKSHDEHPTEIADLAGKRMVVASESEKNRKLKIQLVKRLTGDAQLKGRFMRQDYFTFTRQFKLILVTNNKPRVDEDSEAVWRRLRLIPFDVVIPAGERDPDLLNKLKHEAPGILRWLVEGCLAWQCDGLKEPGIVNDVTGEYRRESNPIGRFFEECCVFEFEAWAQSQLLIEAYRRWCDETGEQPDADRDFYESLRRHGCKSLRKAKARGWSGVRLLEMHSAITDSTVNGVVARIGNASGSLRG